MHELSIASSIVDSVTESLAAYPGARVVEVRLRVGSMAAVVEDSLQFCFGLATEGTPLAGARLAVRTLPVVVYCAACARNGEVAGVQSVGYLSGLSSPSVTESSATRMRSPRS